MIFAVQIYEGLTREVLEFNNEEELEYYSRGFFDGASIHCSTICGVFTLQDAEEDPGLEPEVAERVKKAIQDKQMLYNEQIAN